MSSARRTINRVDLCKLHGSEQFRSSKVRFQRQRSVRYKWKHYRWQFDQRTVTYAMRSVRRTRVCFKRHDHSTGSPNVTTTTGAPVRLRDRFAQRIWCSSYTVTPSKTGVRTHNSFDAAKIAAHVTSVSLLTVTSWSRRMSVVTAPSRHSIPV